MTPAILRQIMKEKKLSPYDVSYLAKITAASIYNFLDGKTMRKATVDKLKKAFP